MRVRFDTYHINLVHSYFPPYSNTYSSPEDVQFICDLRGPTLLIGDLSAHHPYLGDPLGTFNQRGEVISNLLLNTDFQILNDASPTRIDDRKGSLSRLDLVLGNVSLQRFSSSFSLGEDVGNDHLPIEVTLKVDVPPRPNFEQVT